MALIQIPGAQWSGTGQYTISSSTVEMFAAWIARAGSLLGYSPDSPLRFTVTTTERHWLEMKQEGLQVEPRLCLAELRLLLFWKELTELTGLLPNLAMKIDSMVSSMSAMQGMDPIICQESQSAGKLPTPHITSSVDQLPFESLTVLTRDLRNLKLELLELRTKVASLDNQVEKVRGSVASYNLPDKIKKYESAVRSIYDMEDKLSRFIVSQSSVPTPSSISLPVGTSVRGGSGMSVSGGKGLDRAPTLTEPDQVARLNRQVWDLKEECKALRQDLNVLSQDVWYQFGRGISLTGVPLFPPKILSGKMPGFKNRKTG